MTKRRTRKQKEKINRDSLMEFYHNPEAKISIVKRDFDAKIEPKSKIKLNGKSAKRSDKIVNTHFNKRDIVKSLSLASFILCLELVLYFIWK